MPPKRTGPAIANVASSIAIVTSYHSSAVTDGSERSDSSDNEDVRRISFQHPSEQKSEDFDERVIPNCPVDHQSSGKELVNAVFPCSIEHLYEMLFTKNSKFYTDFQLARGTCGACARLKSYEAILRQIMKCFDNSFY